MEFIQLKSTEDDIAALWRELLCCVGLCVIATCITMFVNNDTIIKTEYYYFAHRHSWTCYLGWSILNAIVITVPYFIFSICVFQFPIFLNSWIFLTNMYVRFSKNTVTKDKTSLTLSKFNDLLTKEKQ
jgi:hypothetical protein